LSKPNQVLEDLAGSLDVKAVMKKHGLSADELKEIIASAAELMGDHEEHVSVDSPYVIHTDGASRGNPGPAGAGFVISRNDRMIEAHAQYLDKKTNNQAEYQALILALERALELGAKKIAAYADSELLVKQIKGEYKVTNKNIAPLFQKAKELIEQLDSFEITHIYREENQKADMLANRAIDEFMND